ncbi:hypothetical protein A7P89_02900 [Eikenella corrodens]|uniref:Uncharacterized protein n=1 Tax=Eikenella corrodens TaxID=539 RepID=A0A1A9RSA7_EIKCO|nr:hypothetical protein [Eikenella corrodens]OAM23851.1 hypothetical protein A7P89_02900 [Eikenella corrodens]
MYSFIAYLNLAISLFGLWATVSRIGDALHFLNKFAGYDNSSGVTIGAYITLMALNIIMVGSLTSVFFLCRTQKNRAVHAATLAAYIATVILIDISLYLNLFIFTDIR